jgi:Fe-S cluster assembly iron-binding protein IscA
VGILKTVSGIPSVTENNRHPQSAGLQSGLAISLPCAEGCKNSERQLHPQHSFGSEHGLVVFSFPLTPIVREGIHMSKGIRHFLVGEPGPEESAIIRLAMFASGLLAVLAGIVAATQFHWAALITIPFGGLMLWAWWIATRAGARRASSSQPIVKLTEAAARMFAKARTQQGAANSSWLLIAKESEQYQIDFISQADSRTHVLFESCGISIAVPRESVDALQGTEIDYVRHASGEGFRFRKA